MPYFYLTCINSKDKGIKIGRQTITTIKFDILVLNGSASGDLEKELTFWKGKIANTLDNILITSNLIICCTNLCFLLHC